MMLLPSELWWEVCEQLPLEDLDTFSLLSKYHRDIALPLLFSRIKLSDKTIEGFESGSLSHLRAIVRHISLSDLVRPQATTQLRLSNDGPDGEPWPYDMVDTIELAVRFSRGLRLFPNISSLHIPFTSTMEFEWLIPVAIFKAIAHYPFYRTLKRLTVECIVIHHFSQQYTSPMFVYSHLSKDSRDFIRAAGGESSPWVTSLERLDFSADDNILLPSALEEATTTFISDCTERLNLYFYEANLYKDQTAPWLFFIHSENTLRKLKIHTTALLTTKWGLNGQIVIPDNPKLTMPNVRELWLISNATTINYYTIFYIVRIFPNTQHLRIDATSYAGDPTNMDPYDGISISLPDLRTAVLPCPLVSTTWQPMTPKELRRIVARWRLIGRLRKLEWIAYVSGFEPADDCWYFSTGIAPAGADMFVTKVITGGEGGGRENYRVWTQAGNRVGKFNNLEKRETL